MELILMRHGKAEKSQKANQANVFNETNDFQRQLTAEGRRKVKNASAGLACLIQSGQTERNIKIWSSALTRAKETSEIVCDILKFEKEKIYYHDALASGDFGACFQDLQSLPANVTLIIVGHEPYLNQWAEQLSGIKITFKKSSCAAFSVNCLNPVAGNLKWYATASTLSRIGEKS